MVTLWPEMLQWSWMGEGDFWCSLNLSAKVLADSPMYSSSDLSSLHLYLYITPLLLVIGSLSRGAMSRSFMVWPPLKCTCTPYFGKCFWSSNLALVGMVPPCVYFCCWLSSDQFDCYCFCFCFLMGAGFLFWLYWWPRWGTCISGGLGTDGLLLSFAAMDQSILL